MEFGKDKGDSHSGYLLFLHGMRLDIGSDRITGIVVLFVMKMQNAKLVLALFSARLTLFRPRDLWIFQMR